jgi:hypothetical protein
MFFENIFLTDVQCGYLKEFQRKMGYELQTVSNIKQKGAGFGRLVESAKKYNRLSENTRAPGASVLPLAQVFFRLPKVPKNNLCLSPPSPTEKQ